MTKKHNQILCLILSFILAFSLSLSVFADGEDLTPDSNIDAGAPGDGGDNSSQEGSTETPVLQSIDINANYYTGENNTYTIIFTTMDEIPAFTNLSVKIKFAGASVEQASFDENILADGTADIMRGSDYAILPLVCTNAKAIPEKTTLCTLVATSAAAPNTEILTIPEFSIIKAEETESFRIWQDCFG